MLSLESDEEVPSMPPLESNKEVKEKIFRTLTPNKLLTRLPVLLAQIKAGNDYYKLNQESANTISFLSA